MSLGNTNNQMCYTSVAGVGTSNRQIRIEDSCIVEINNRFFLIVLFDLNGFDRVAVFRISRQQAIELINSGVRICRVIDTLPTNVGGRAVELHCVFVVDGFAFIVLEIESGDRLIVVRAPLCAGSQNDF